MSNQHQIKTESGLTINPIESIQDLLSGTSFQEDRVAQDHLNSLGNSFYEISKTAEGQVMLGAMEGLVGQIKTESAFKDAVKVCFRLAKKMSINPWVQFGIFIGLFGLLVALIGQFGNLAAFGGGLAGLMKSVGMDIFGSTLMSHGVKQAVGNFMGGREDFFEN